LYDECYRDLIALHVTAKWVQKRDLKASIMDLAPDRYPDFSVLATLCQRSKVGKLLPDALYVHVSALAALDPLLQAYESEARQLASVEAATLVKFSTEKPSLSYLVYPDFDAILTLPFKPAFRLTSGAARSTIATTATVTTRLSSIAKSISLPPLTPIISNLLL